jgi:TetR/AcrR family transcriptional regulator
MSVVKKASKTLRASKKKASKTAGRRSIGRPAASAPGVGRQALIEKTCELLRTLPPDRVTRAEVARHAKVDPSLIRYYFKERSALLVAATEQLTSQYRERVEQKTAASDHSPAALLRLRIDNLLDLEMANPFFHRLIVEEIVPAKSAAAKQLLQQLTSRGTAGYGAIVEAGVRDGSLRHVEPAFLFLAVISMCEFFLTGLPILRVALGEEIDQATLTKRYREFVLDLVLNGLRAPARK